MVRELERIKIPQSTEFPETASAANPVFFRTYSRLTKAGLRETWDEVCDRTLKGIIDLGRLTRAESAIIEEMQRHLKALPSGRWLWVGGTEWITKPKNFSGAYNCTSTNLEDWSAFALMMDLAMMGCGTGAVIEPQHINQLPAIRNYLNLTLQGEIGSIPWELRCQHTKTCIEGNTVTIYVGDSREGWVESYKSLLEISTNQTLSTELKVIVDLSNVRQTGEPLKGFGGVANPVKLPDLYKQCASILNKAIGRQLNSVECCLLIDQAAVAIVAGNIRRSAGMRQFRADDGLGATAKDNLWQQDTEGNWRIDPERDALRMANHTRVFHRKPTLEECIESVRKQYYSGEGAIQWAGESVARANCDLLNTPQLKKDFLQAYDQGKAKEWIQQRHPKIDSQELEHRLNRYGLNPCGEIIGSNFHCNLSEIHLNQIDPEDYKEQEKAFTAGALSVAALLNHQFLEPRYQKSRELDPIVGVSFTGLFDFFVHAFGVDWLRWWAEGRVETPQGLAFKEQEAKYLTYWKDIVHRVVWDYCDRHQLKHPNRCTTVQPSGTKSLLTGASPGWHPPKSQRFIRRITFGKNDPVALACIDYGYNVIPSQSDKDEHGNLLNDPFDPRVTEWLVEIPISVSWADLPGADEINVSKFSALAQFDFALQVQRWYVTHNTSSTIELRSEEVEPLGQRIYQGIQNDEGYISAALLARFDDLQSFPRLPFEPIDKSTYERLTQEVKSRRRTDDFCAVLSRYDSSKLADVGPSGCDSDKCMFPVESPAS
ncbi:ribonucleoside-triphosphate reductase, adenosylcobalamin-dependent [Anabaenopsis elenkinii]|uniref:Ribonucleoside-triphosphate reductase, adenosylcobalamin-dependent n=1 Tax=Anabaenopsis elenkinii CCIBt3563 TaxID=2779889 RepID=A0A7S6RC61_9CYAN|nr:ribonucleoside-triphosphate reductase, adenosylcobalamin-dependent [Anabaenopsis elenkinii]QOV22253.1 ribonucleoside-triphosphate reductase, adenosylcobalamin-dependent [Anabaenopsis elenkinii CCIBt3563]